MYTFFRKTYLLNPMKERNHDQNPFKTKEINPKSPLKFSISIVIFLALWVLLLFFWFPHTTPPHLVAVTIDDEVITPKPAPPRRLCRENYKVYIYDLPEKFNVGLLRECRHMNMYTDMCPHVANSGLGQPMRFGDGGGVGSWFATNQFTAEMLFHKRLENHPCRTRDPGRATLFYLPFYGGLHASSKFGDALALQFSRILSNATGKHHFVVLGRTVWDFTRDRKVITNDNDSNYGGSCLLNLPPLVHNVSVLIVERHPWQGSNQHGIPYPSYFHPSSSAEMLTWQRKVAEIRRPNLFSFVGGARAGVEKAAVRDRIIRQCEESPHCNLLKCGSGASRCHEPAEVMRVKTASEFCLEPPGDSFTRRSIFDAVVAGCVPVFFSRHTAYSQYLWYLPADPRSYSVLIAREEEQERIAEVLQRIPRKRVERMRREVIRLIPNVTYFNPNSSQDGFRDAVDIALAALSVVKNEI